MKQTFEWITINKKDLISLIQQTNGFLNPKIELEQYCIDAQSAVDIVFFAGVEFNDIKNKLVIDLGAGTGRLSIASAYLRASYVLSVDIDINALRILKENVKGLGLEDIVLPLCSDVNRFEIVNVSALFGATYPVFCFFEYDLKETHYTAVSKALIRIAEKENRFCRMRWVLLSAGILLE